jgi:hypothetical protein
MIASALAASSLAMSSYSSGFRIIAVLRVWVRVPASRSRGARHRCLHDTGRAGRSKKAYGREENDDPSTVPQLGEEPAWPLPQTPAASRGDERGVLVVVASDVRRGSPHRPAGFGRSRDGDFEVVRWRVAGGAVGVRSMGAVDRRVDGLGVDRLATCGVAVMVALSW